MQVRFLLARLMWNYKIFNKYILLSKTLQNKFLEDKALKIHNGFSFVSLTSPFIINNLKLNYLKKSEKKVFVKQSYILLSWFYYISTFEHKDSKKRLKVCTLPSIKKIFTLTKAPMAHRNWSKEQYQFSHFKFKISFNSSLTTQTTIKSVNEAIFFSLIAKKNLFSFETNVFFLKSFTVFFFFTDKRFFNYYKFIKFF